MRNPSRTVWAAFAALAPAAGEARMFTRSVLDAWDLSHLSDTAELLVSELITNAVKHAGGVIDPLGDLPEIGEVAPVMLALSVRTSLLIEVWDQSDTPPIRRTAADDDVNGRGLELVEMLAGKWGCEILPAGGKIIWSTLDLDACDVAE